MLLLLKHHSNKLFIYLSTASLSTHYSAHHSVSRASVHGSNLFFFLVRLIRVMLAIVPKARTARPFVY